MSGCQVVPEGLADVPPGPRLAGVLSGIELARLSGFDCVQVLKARYRQLNHERAQLMAAMVEVGLCGIGPDDRPRRRRVPDEFAADEIRAALVLTRRSADAQFALAYDLVTRLPAVHAAMDTGVLDEPRARVFSDWATGLHPQIARALCAQLLPRAPELTTGQLIEQIKKLAIAVDPDWAQRRYEQALANRKVISSRNPDGSANLSGLNLPLERVAAACGPIDTLAKTAKHAGDPRPLDHLRAELFLGMTEGTDTGLDDHTILQRLHTTHHSDEPDNNGPTDSEAAAHDGGRGPAGEPVAQPRPRGAGMELRVGLSTLLGHDEYPSELAGGGPLHATLARELATTLARGQWRFAITDAHGQLQHCGITPARPLGWPTRTAGCRQIAELQIPATTLHQLTRDLDALGPWGPVVTDLAHQHTTAQHPTAADPTQRFPGTALRRQVQIRDRSCIMIGCRAPAHSTDTDHTLNHTHGGATTEHNLGTLCRHDHRLKHDGSRQLPQPDPGVLRWISHLGHAYPVRPSPIIEPLPDPIPHAQPPTRSASHPTTTGKTPTSGNNPHPNPNHTHHPTPTPTMTNHHSDHKQGKP